MSTDTLPENVTDDGVAAQPEDVAPGPQSTREEREAMVADIERLAKDEDEGGAGEPAVDDAGIAPEDIAPEERKSPAKEPEPAPQPKTDAPKLSDEMTALARDNYGFSEEDLAGFESDADLDKALRDFDHQFTSEGRRAQQQPAPEKQDPAAPAPPKPEQPPADKPAGEGSRLSDFLKEEGLSDAAVAAVQAQERLLDDLTQRFSAIEKERQEQQQRSNEELVGRMNEDLAAAVKDLNLPEVFGSGGQLNHDNMNRLWDSAIALGTGMVQRGHTAPPFKQLVLRAARMEFAPYLERKLRRELAAKAKEQSSKTLGTPTPSPAKPAPQEKVDWHSDEVPSVLRDEWNRLAAESAEA